jgi:hypothetical protein
MPTPNELFRLVRDMAGEGHKRMMNPTAHADRYVSRRARAINFGVYATDLVYASNFKLNVEVARYYLTTKKLAESLGITNAFTDADFVRLEKNLARGDSLDVISNEAYQRAYDKLQEEQMGPVLSLVLAGGWLESMHLVMRQIEVFGPSEGLMARVAEQKVTLEHMLDMMAPHEQDPDVSTVYKSLLGILDVYDSVAVRTLERSGRSSSGRMVVGDDRELYLTAEKYRELEQSVGRLRAELTRPENEQNA